jgi:hypothetical protein
VSHVISKEALSGSGHKVIVCACGSGIFTTTIVVVQVPWLPVPEDNVTSKGWKGISMPNWKLRNIGPSGDFLAKVTS